jgi:hypothetical protein
VDTQAGAQQRPLADTEAEADRVTQAIQGSDATAVLIGGLAVRLRCPSASRPPLQREYKDIDLVTLRRMTTKLTDLLEGMGHIPDKRFNAIQGRERLFFYDEQNGRQLDVFVDRFEMCHGFDLRERVTADPIGTTLPLADLLLTKMQVVELNLKDMQDIAALLQDHPLTDSDATGISVEYITWLTRADWGLHHTIELTIEKLRDPETLAGLVSDQAAYSLATQLDDLFRAMQDAPKSTGWKLRAKVGERKRWYELPEEART